MKTKTKALALSLCAVLLVVATVFATMAYLTAQTATVKNTFTVGKVAITLDETDVTVYGEAEVPAARVTENSYKLIPGHEYKKDPTVHVDKESENCWVFVKVVDEITSIQDGTTVASQMGTNHWLPLEVEGQTVENVYYYQNIVDADDTNGTDLPVFQSFQIKKDANVSEYNGKIITVIGYAVQADGFSTAAAAWTAAPAGWN